MSSKPKLVVWYQMWLLPHFYIPIDGVKCDRLDEVREYAKEKGYSKYLIIVHKRLPKDKQEKRQQRPSFWTFRAGDACYVGRKGAKTTQNSKHANGYGIVVPLRYDDIKKKDRVSCDRVTLTGAKK